MDMKVEVYKNRKTTQIKHDRAPTPTSSAKLEVFHADFQTAV